VDDVALSSCAVLLNSAFPGASFSSDLLRWQYRDNPSGQIVGWNAIAADGSLAGHYVVQPLEATIDGALERGALSFNTATHPAHQGKGLFTALGKKTFESASALGFGFVAGVANANSTPGFTRKLGFTLVRPLDVRIGIALEPIENAVAQFERIWTPETARWRSMHPQRGYCSVGTSLYAPTGQPFVRAIMARGSCFANLGSTDIGFRPLDLWLGLEPSGVPRGSLKIPEVLRPSPLNFIYLDLSNRVRAIDARGVRFRAIDFDPF
jgi:GNAT superfamily N-acetyltransferase